ncbi:MAG: aminoglycoside 3'-phosphotransferase [Candidatus Hydrogenedentes bacterium]|nr:aminoglycoside 3'-phosphotransferase [Candidatus Hydrogenedentota bacterium]
MSTLPSLPDAICELVEDHAAALVSIGCSEARVFRLTANGSPDLFLKTSPRHSVNPLEHEAARLRWLKGRLSVPRLIHYVEDDDCCYLLMSAISGVMACDPARAGHEMETVKLLAEGLRHIHAVPTSGCPFDHSAGVMIAQAEARVAAGHVDESNFQPEWRGCSAISLLRELAATKPATEDLAFTHGDYCLPNVLIHEHNISGFIDMSRSGVSDPYRDIALALRSITYNIGPQWREPFVTAYGLSSLDDARVRFYTLLDEFF